MRKQTFADGVRAMWDRLLRDARGQDLVEYALVAGLVALVAVASMKTVGTALSTVFTTLKTTLTTNV